MQISQPINFQDHQLSSSFFNKCEELVLIQQPFSSSQASLQESKRDLQTQFQLLRALTQTKKHRLKLRVNSVMENKKNRYPQQSIYQHSRVVLQDEQGAGFINANWVPLNTKKLIITQAPIPNTLLDFQNMIVQQKVQCVIMLCNIIQSGKTRCIDYVQGKVINKQQRENCLEISDVEIKNKDGQVYRYKHVHYSQWPDRGVPENVQHLDWVINEALKYERIVIHCSAGLGRSGLATCALSLKIDFLQNTSISIFRTARILRQNRFGAVQNSEQYSLLYRYLQFLSNQ